MKYLELYEGFELYKLISESNVEFSPTFKNVLDKMDNDLARKIISLSGQDHNVTTNYFDAPYGDNKANDIVTFITDRKAKEMGAKITNEWEVIQVGRELNNTQNNSEYFKKFDMDVPKTIIYPPVGTIGKIEQTWISPNSGKVWVKFVSKDFPPIVVNREALRSNGPTEKIYYEENRQSTRIGRGIRALLTSAKIKFTDKEIEEFVNRWKSTVDRINDIFFNFEVVNGEDIVKWYDYKSYESESGQLGNSCMKSVEDNYFDIYVNNPSIIQMVIYRSPENRNKIRGRALLWKIGDKFFMDRIYTTLDSDMDLFRQYSRKNGWYYKLYNQSSPELICISSDGSKVDLGSQDIKLISGEYDNYPYMDTMKYYVPTTGIISNKSKKNCLVLESTDGIGDPMENNYVWVDFYGDEYPEEDLQWCDYAEADENSEGETENIEGGNRLPEDCFYDRYYGVYISNDFKERHMKECSETGVFRLESEMRGVYKTPGKFICRDYSGDKFVYSNHHEEFIPVEMAVDVNLGIADVKAKQSDEEWGSWFNRTSPKNRDHDWRALDDGSRKEINVGFGTKNMILMLILLNQRRYHLKK